MPPTEPISAARAGRRSNAHLRRPSRWVGVTVAMCLLAVAVAVTFAVRWHHAATREQQRGFDAEAAGVSSAVATSLQRVGDLTSVVAAEFQADPSVSSTAFHQWMRAIDVDDRYPGYLSFGLIRRIPRAGLAAFLDRVHADPNAGWKPPTLASLPVRADYCLLAAGDSAANQTSMSLSQVGSFDLCSMPGIGVIFASTRDSGQPFVIGSTDKNGQSMLSIVRAVYTTPKTPATLAERRRQLVGWVGGALDAGGILEQAVAGHRGIAVQLVRANSTETAAGQAAATDPSSPVSARTMIASVGKVHGPNVFHVEKAISADGEWRLKVAGKAPAGVSPQMQAFAVLGIFLVLIALGLSLVVTLGRGRQRAMRMVDQKTDELRYQALHDALTGLPNRALILDRTEHLLARARRDATVPAALFLDLDGFKGINDTLGHAAGDELLCAVANRLRGVMRDGDTVGRLGGDEFVVLVEGASSARAAELVAQRILDVIREPFALPGSANGYTISTSIGIAEGLRDDADEFLRDADIALYEAKASGRDCFVHFDPAMHDTISDRTSLEHDLRRALDNEEIFLVYQPTVDLAGLAVTGVEALARWQHPTRGLVPPDRFIPIAEETGLIHDLGCFVLDEACRRAATWHAEGLPVTVSVNVSARQLDGEGLYDDVSLALQSSGLDPRHLVLEITETSLMRQPEVTARLLERIKTLGVGIAIDDFGTGYSSLAYLQQFPVDAIKIDRSFVASVADSPEADALIGTLVQLGKTLGLNTLAEGIEDDKQLQHVRRADCDSGQGYLFGRPMDAEAAHEFLAARRDRLSVWVPRQREDATEQAV